MKRNNLNKLKTRKLSLLVFIIIFAFSCEKDHNLETKEMSSVKLVDMNNVGRNYDKIVSEIHTNPNLDITIGNFVLEMRNMKPAEGISVEETTFLVDEKNNRAIIIDNITESIYVRLTNIDEESNYKLFGFKNNSDLKSMLKSENYNVDILINSTSYKNRLSRTSKVEFVRTENSFLIKKPILTNREEHLYAKQNMSHKVTCLVENNEEKKQKQTLYNNVQNSGRSRTWNLVVYKEHSSTSTSDAIDAVNSTFRSLSSKDGSNWYYSNTPYANLNVTYRVVQNPIPESNDLRSLFYNFVDYLSNNSVPTNRFTHSYMYIKSSSSLLKDGVGGWGAAFNYRVGVSRNKGSDFAHELGHTLGASHYDSTTWDSSLGWFGWWGESIMHSVSGGNAWYADVQWKYYSSTNRNKVKRTLD